MATVFSSSGREQNTFKHAFFLQAVLAENVVFTPPVYVHLSWLLSSTAN